MPDSPRAAAAPWIVAAIAGLVFVVLLVVYLVPLQHARDDLSPGALTSSEKAAVDAASTEAVNVLSFRRAHFAADYARALAGATGSLKKDVAGRRAAVLKTITDGKFDLSARATHEALVGPDGRGSGAGYVVLVTINGYKSTEPAVPTQQNLQVTVVRHDGTWLVDGIMNIALS